MRIATQLRVISALTLIVLALLSAGLAWSFIVFQSEKSDYALIEAIRLNFFERTSFRDQYSLYREDRARGQWEANREIAGRLLIRASAQMHGLPDRFNLELLRWNLEASTDIFHRIVDNVGALKTAGDDHQAHEELDRRLSSQMLMKAAAFRDTTTALQEASAQRVEQTFKNMIIVMGGFWLALALATILTLTHLDGSIRKRLAALHQGARRVAGGDLSYRISCSGSDELADLAQSINAMTDKQQAFATQLEIKVNAYRQVQIDLLNSEERLHLALSSAGMAMWDWQIMSGALVFNARWAEIQGCAPEDLPARVESWLSRVCPEDMPMVKEKLARHFKGETATYESEHRVRHKDGHWVWVQGRGKVVERDETGNPVRAVGVALDINVKKMAAEAQLSSQLKERQLLRRIESLIKQSTDSIMMLDANTRILEVSDGCIRMYGYTRDEFLGMKSVELRAAHAREEASDFTQRLAQQGPLFYQTWHCRKDGSSFPIEVGAAMIDDGGESLVQVIIRDISERVSERSNMELELAAYAKRLETASRRVLVVQEEAKRRFSGELHDRTSPNLAAIKINLAIVASLTPAQSGERAERLADMQALVEDTDASLREICSELRPPILDYAGLAAALEGNARQSARRTGVAIHIDCVHYKKRLEPALESLLFRVYQEALTNCLKHARARSIMVRLSNGVQPFTLTIVDDGDGFDLNMLEKKGQIGGLGLLNMREMIEFSGGRFTIASHLGQGTRIEVTI